MRVRCAWLYITARRGGGVADEVELGEQPYDECLEEVRLLAELRKRGERAPILEAGDLVVPHGRMVRERAEEEGKRRLGDMPWCTDGDGREQIESSIAVEKMSQHIYYV